MTNEQMFSAICLYRKAIRCELDMATIDNEILKARKSLDSSFSLKGEEDASIADYLKELLIIQSSIS